MAPNSSSCNSRKILEDDTGRSVLRGDFGGRTSDGETDGSEGRIPPTVIFLNDKL